MYPNETTSNKEKEDDSSTTNKEKKLNYMMNIFTGTPYTVDDGKDGYNATAPVASFPPKWLWYT